MMFRRDADALNVLFTRAISNRADSEISRYGWPKTPNQEGMSRVCFERCSDVRHKHKDVSLVDGLIVTRLRVEDGMDGRDETKRNRSDRRER